MRTLFLSFLYWTKQKLMIPYLWLTKIWSWNYPTILSWMERSSMKIFLKTIISEWEFSFSIDRIGEGWECKVSDPFEPLLLLVILLLHLHGHWLRFLLNFLHLCFFWVAFHRLNFLWSVLPYFMGTLSTIFSSFGVAYRPVSILAYLKYSW